MRIVQLALKIVFTPIIFCLLGMAIVVFSANQYSTCIKTFTLIKSLTILLTIAFILSLFIRKAFFITQNNIKAFNAGNFNHITHNILGNAAVLSLTALLLIYIKMVTQEFNNNNIALQMITSNFIQAFYVFYILLLLANFLIYLWVNTKQETIQLYNIKILSRASDVFMIIAALTFWGIMLTLYFPSLPTGECGY